MIDVDIGERSEDRNDRIEMKINNTQSRSIDINIRLDSLVCKNCRLRSPMPTKRAVMRGRRGYRNQCINAPPYPIRKIGLSFLV